LLKLRRSFSAGGNNLVEGKSIIDSRRKLLKVQANPLARFFAMALVICVAPVFLHATTEVQKRRVVVVISLDGFPAYALDDPRPPIPTLRNLAQEGAGAASMQPINPTITWPNHTSTVTGVDASEHQVLFNGLLIRMGIPVND
jgi:hypothetical protein